MLSTVALVFLAHAGAAEYREIALSDGRVVRGEVLESTDTGLRLRLQQGITFISYQDVRKIDSIDAATWRAQSPWRAAVPPFQAREERLEASAREAVELVGSAINGFPNVETVRPGAGLSADAAEAIASCGADPRCVLEPARDAGLDLVILGEVAAPPGSDDTLTVTVVFTSTDRARRSASIPWLEGDDRAAVVALNVLYPALDLEPDAERVAALIESTAPASSRRSDPPDEEPDAPAAQPPESVSGLTRGQVLGLSFVPVPGFPSLYQRDLKRFGASWIAVVPAASLFVGASGASAIRKRQFVTMGVAGYYVTTVAVNQVMGMNTLEDRPLFSVRPTEGGGVAEFTIPLR